MTQAARSISTIGMSHEEWLRNRRIGGSDVAAILGVTKFKTPLEAYEAIINPEENQVEENPKMKAGKKLERVIAEWYEEETGHKLRHDYKIRFHPQYPFLSASMDRTIVAIDSRGPGVFEAKNTTGNYARTWETNIPLEYYFQLQHYLNVTGYKWGAVAVLIDGWDLRYYEFKRNDGLISEMTWKLEAFWMNHVVPMIPPEPTTEADIIKMFPKGAPGKMLETTDETYDTWMKAKTIAEKIKPLDKELKKLKESIKLVMRDAEILTSSGETLATFKATKNKEYFDEEKFKADYPDLYNEYLDEKPGTRRFLLK